MKTLKDTSKNYRFAKFAIISDSAFGCILIFIGVFKRTNDWSVLNGGLQFMSFKGQVRKQQRKLW
ncbi:MAG: hypothetical protein IKO98_05150, partial [Bacteroidales bacterium]|nr:hypothetical protein [Bacteroidales bacterium]